MAKHRIELAGRLRRFYESGEVASYQHKPLADTAYMPDPEGYECYAHLAIHSSTTTVYLVEPSGDPELIADDLDGFLARLAG